MLSYDQSLSCRLIDQAHHHHILMRHFHADLLVLFAYGLPSSTSVTNNDELSLHDTIAALAHCETHKCRESQQGEE